LVFELLVPGLIALLCAGLLVPGDSGPGPQYKAAAAADTVKLSNDQLTLWWRPSRSTRPMLAQVLAASTYPEIIQLSAVAGEE
jgi:hypothetical protein